MTARREIPLNSDTLGWVHSELSDIKSRLSIVAQAADQSRGLAADASENGHSLRAALNQLEGLAPALMHVQDDLRSLRELLSRAQDDINSLRQSREEAERRDIEDSESIRLDRNEISRRLTGLERSMEGWQERLFGSEEHHRRVMEMTSQLAMRMESIENQISEGDSSHSRTASTMARIDQELQRLSGAVLSLQSEDATQRERIGSNVEMLRRLEAVLEQMRLETNKISRIDDRLELVQAERTRHNERLNEITTELETVEARLNANDERASLIEARMTAHQDDVRKLRERLQREREQLGAFLDSLREMEADFRKREISQLEKELKDIRGRAFNVEPE